MSKGQCVSVRGGIRKRNSPNIDASINLVRLLGSSFDWADITGMNVSSGGPNSCCLVLSPNMIRRSVVVTLCARENDTSRENFFALRILWRLIEENRRYFSIPRYSQIPFLLLLLYRGQKPRRSHCLCSSGREHAINRRKTTPSLVRSFVRSLIVVNMSHCVDDFQMLDEQ